LILRKIIKLFAKQILHFKLVMHQLISAGARSQRSLSFFSWNLGILLLRERKERKGEKMGKGKRMWEEKKKQENRKETKVRKRKGKRNRR